MACHTKDAGKDLESVLSIFECPRYGSVMESYELAQVWLEKHGRKFGGFVNGRFLTASSGDAIDVRDPVGGKPLAKVHPASSNDVSSTFKAAVAAQDSWAALSPFMRSNHLYRCGQVRSLYKELCFSTTTELFLCSVRTLGLRYVANAEK